MVAADKTHLQRGIGLFIEGRSSDSSETLMHVQVWRRVTTYKRDEQGARRVAHLAGTTQKDQDAEPLP